MTVRTEIPNVASTAGRERAAGEDPPSHRGVGPNQGCDDRPLELEHDEEQIEERHRDERRLDEVRHHPPPHGFHDRHPRGIHPPRDIGWFEREDRASPTIGGLLPVEGFAEAPPGFRSNASPDPAHGQAPTRFVVSGLTAAPAASLAAPQDRPRQTLLRCEESLLGREPAREVRSEPARQHAGKGVAARVVIESDSTSGTPKRPPEGAVSAGRRRYSVMDAAVTAWTSSARGDLDLAGLRLLGDGDGEGQDAVVVGGHDLVAVQALAEEQLPAEVSLGSLRHEDLIVLGPDPRPSRPNSEDVLLDGHLDEPGIDAGQVELDLELVAPTVGVNRDRRARRWLSSSSVIRSISRNGSKRINMMSPFADPRATGVGDRQASGCRTTSYQDYITSNIFPERRRVR